MTEHALITQKLPQETHRLLKRIAAHTGEKQYAVLHRLLAAEWQRVQREDGATKKGS